VGVCRRRWGWSVGRRVEERVGLERLRKDVCGGGMECKTNKWGETQWMMRVGGLSSQPNIFLKTTISKSFTDQFPLQCGLFFFAFLSPNTHQHCPNFSPRISLQMDQPDSLCTHLTKRLSQHVNESQIISSPCSVDAWSLQFSGPTTRQHCPNSLPRRLF